MATNRPLFATALPSEDFYLDYNSEVPSLKAPTSAESSIQTPQSASRYKPWVSCEPAAELVVKVQELPHDVSDQELRALFEKEGNIRRINIDRSQDPLDGLVFATITFCPRPEKFDVERKKISLWHYSEQFPEAVEHILPMTVISPQASRIESQMHRRRSFPEHITLFAGTIDFGFLTDSHDIRIMHSSSCFDAFCNTLALDTRRRELSVCFTEAAETESFNTFKLRISMQHIEQIMKLKPVNNSNNFGLVLHLATPPPLYQMRSNSGSSPSISSAGPFQDSHWQRVTGVNNSAVSASAAVALSAVNGTINIGAWTTYRINFDSSKHSAGQLNDFFRILREHNVKLSDAPDALSISTGKMLSCWSWLGAFDLQSPDYSQNLPWHVLYQLEVCVSQGLLSEYGISLDFVAHLATMQASKAVQLLEYVADMNKRIYQPMSIFKLNAPITVSCTPVPRHSVLLRQATVTPSTIYFASPSVERTNRVLRQFSQYADRFMRVRFSDEKTEGRLWSSMSGSCDPLYDRIRSCILNGIMVGGRHYEYLASGNSQFREHGAYFFSSTANLRAIDIRYWLGDLREIKTVSKFMSRMGQGFSTTRAIQGTRVVIKEDHDHSYNGYTFTDGVGKISQFLAQSIAIELGLPRPNDPPSVFQFRLGGCKGVLALWPDIAKAREIHIRPSQYKFSAIHEGLEIIRCSSLASADLNRQLITCLVTLGVPEQVFLNMLWKQLADLSEAMRSETKAVEVLTQRVDANHVTLQLVHLVRHGFVAAKEPFVMSLMSLWRAWSLKKLKDKARITIDQGAFVLGCTDESRTLRGHFESDAQLELLLGSREECIAALPQIHLRISTGNQTGTYQTITGPCIVARNPSLHPGDIRVVNAVDSPHLRHLKDVVVFPQTGDRDIPSMCSGGDLDGDDFLVSWDPDLIPPIHMWNVPPMKFESAAPTSKQEITIEDCADFFVNHMKYDNLGKIANAWQAISDDSPVKASDPRCNRLASLHSTAVDFPKTGVPALLPSELKPKKYPHFMPSKSRPKSKIYHSKTVLGKIYDEVEGIEYNPLVSGKGFDHRILAASFKGHPCFFNDVGLSPLKCYHDRPDDMEQLEVADLKIALQAKALLIKREYDTLLRRIMAQHEINTEFEVWTGFVLSHNQASGDYKFHETIGELASSLKERFRTACIDAAHEIFSDSKTTVPSDGEDFIALDLEHWTATPSGYSSVPAKSSGQTSKKLDTYEMMAPFVQAMYAITQDEVEHHESLEPLERASNPPPFISFPWLFSDYLGRMAVDNPTPDTLATECVSSVGHEPRNSPQRKPVDTLIPTTPDATSDNGGLKASKHAIPPITGSGPDEPGAKTISEQVDLATESQHYSMPGAQDLLIDLTPEPSEHAQEGTLIDLSDDDAGEDEPVNPNGTTHHSELLDLFTDAAPYSTGLTYDLLQDLTFDTPPASQQGQNDDAAPSTTTQESRSTAQTSPPPTSPLLPVTMLSAPGSPIIPPAPPSSPSTASTSLRPNQSFQSLGSLHMSESNLSMASMGLDVDDLALLFSRKLSLSLSTSASVGDEQTDDREENPPVEGESSFYGGSEYVDNTTYESEYEHRPRYEEAPFVLGYDDDDNDTRDSMPMDTSGSDNMPANPGSSRVQARSANDVTAWWTNEAYEEEIEDSGEIKRGAADEELSPLEKLGRMVGM